MAFLLAACRKEGNETPALHGSPGRAVPVSIPRSMKRSRPMLLALLGLLALVPPAAPSPMSTRFEVAARNSLLAREGLWRCYRLLHAWLGIADPATGLIPRDLLGASYWNGKDAAADNYPFLVLSAYFTDREAFDGPIRRMLENERKLTARAGWLRLTDDYQLAPTPGLRFAVPDAERIFFNSAEYVKDGLLAVTEWLGPSPWSNRAIELVDDSFALAAVETPFGKVPLTGRDREIGVEVSGDYLQALARLYWFSGRDEKYLEWGARLADLYLLPEGGHNPIRDFTTLGLRDHACEIINGLSEIYATMSFAGKAPGGEKWAAKKAAYQPELHALLDRVLEVGRNEDGLFYNAVNPKTGEVTDRRISDVWGYVYDGFYTVYLIDGTEAYRDAALKPFEALNARYRGFTWERNPNPKPGDKGNHDGYADAIEGALNLANRLPADDPHAREGFAWIDSEIRELWSRQADDGFVERWHCDGNFARTTLMYCLWKSQGARLAPWRKDVRLGAVREGGSVAMVVAADRAWQGKLHFDVPRHSLNLHLPIDWPRINQFPEWFTVVPGGRYRVRNEGADGSERIVDGSELRDGIEVRLDGRSELRLVVTPLRSAPANHEKRVGGS